MALTVLYPAANTKKAVYSITHTAGAALETVVIGGTVLEVRVIDIDSSGSKDVTPTWSVSKSGATSTVTLYVNATVTAGYVIVEYIPE